MGKKDSITIFLALSQRELPNVKSWVMPSLKRMKNIDIELILINYTGKDEVLYKGKKKFGHIHVQEINKGERCGFGESHNFAFETIRPKDAFLISNPDLFYHADSIHNLLKTFRDNPDAGLIDARHLPYSHPKEFDPDTHETPWGSGACLFVNSKFFEEAGGFDEKFWMYTEDVDLSWRAWLLGYKVLHEPNALVYHFTGAYFGYHKHRYYLEDVWSARNFLYINYKYFGEKGEKKALELFKSSGREKAFVSEVLEMYEDFKSEHMDDLRYNVLRGALREEKDKIKVTGFNLYHEVRNETFD